jgi:DNA polymerase elongation subunit (family B)
LTKKQQQIYNWLISKPGYLKKSTLEISKRIDFGNKYDLEIALKQARIDYKNQTHITLISKDAKNNKIIRLIPTKLVGKPKNKSSEAILVKNDATVSKNNKTVLKRLYFDLETTPNIVYSWNIGYKLNIGHDNLIKERAIICACYKWEHEKEVKYLTWEDGDDAKLIYALYDILMEADEIIGHNGDNYDIKWFKTRCLYHGILNMPEICSIDTLKLSRKHFRFNSNKLDYIGQFLGIGKKKDTGGFNLWKEVMANNDKSLFKMVEYCKNDVILLEQVYNKISGYIKNKTHLGVLKGNSKCSCPNCGDENTQARGNLILASGTIKKRMQCKSCGKNFTVSNTVYANNS